MPVADAKTISWPATAGPESVPEMVSLALSAKLIRAGAVMVTVTPAAMVASAVTLTAPVQVALLLTMPETVVLPPRSVGTLMSLPIMAMSVGGGAMWSLPPWPSVPGGTSWPGFDISSGIVGMSGWVG